MNSFITFAAESGRQLRLRDYTTFVASGIAGLVANTTVLVIASYSMPVLAAKLTAVLAKSFWSIFRSRISWCSGGATGTRTRRRTDALAAELPAGLVLCYMVGKELNMRMLSNDTGDIKLRELVEPSAANR